MIPQRRTPTPQLASDARDFRPPEPGVEAVPQPGSLWAIITGQAAGTNRYAWTQIDEGDTTAFGAGLADGFAATGTSAAEGSPAYEVNGRIDVPTDGSVRVRLWPAGDLTYYVFEYAKPSSSSVGDVIGPECAYTGALSLFTDPSGRFIGPAETLQFGVLQYDSQFSGGTTTIRLLILFADPSPPLTRAQPTTARTVSLVTETFSGPVGFWGSSATHYSTALADRLIQQACQGADFDNVTWRVHYDPSGHIIGYGMSFQIAGAAASGSVETWNNAGTLVQSPVGIQIWQAHYAADGTAGITGSCTVKVGGVDKTLSFKDGIITGLA